MLFRSHIEFTRDIAEKFNNTFGDTFALPESMILDDVAVVPGIDGQKMSKSYNNTIPLFGTDEEIKKQVMSIVTDSKDVGESLDPESCNVFALHKLVNEENLSDIRKRYTDGDIGYKESKELLAEAIVKLVAPMRERRNELRSDEKAVHKILDEGAEKARAIAEEKMSIVRKNIGVSL